MWSTQIKLKLWESGVLEHWDFLGVCSGFNWFACLVLRFWQESEVYKIVWHTQKFFFVEKNSVLAADS